jgi:hypothetical protein
LEMSLFGRVSLSSLFTRVNPISILAAGVAVAGLFLPWWGVTQTGAAIGRVHLQWTIWNPPHFNLRVTGANTIYWNFALSSVSVLVLGLIAASLVVVGSITLLRRYLIAGLVLSALSLVVYTVAVDYVTTNYCVTALCIQGPVGALSVPGASVNWGFQSGFYIFLLAVLLLAAGVFLNRMIVHTATPRTTTSPVSSASSMQSCSKCGTSLQTGARFCSSCGTAV